MEATSTTEQFADRVNPALYGFSPKLTAIVGAIIGHDYGVRDGVRGGRLTGGLAITSDGYVTAQSTASDDGGAFIGTASDLARNLAAWKADLSAEDRETFERLYASRVTDWR